MPQLDDPDPDAHDPDQANELSELVARAANADNIVDADGNAEPVYVDPADQLDDDQMPPND